MRLTSLLCRQYQFRYWKRYIDRCLYKSNSSEVWHPIVGWKIRRKHPSNFYYDDNRPWTRGFEDNNFISRKKKIDMLVEPIKEWTIFKGDRVSICCMCLNRSARNITNYRSQGKILTDSQKANLTLIIK